MKYQFQIMQQKQQLDIDQNHQEELICSKKNLSQVITNDKYHRQSCHTFLVAIEKYLSGPWKHQASWTCYLVLSPLE